MIDDETEIEIWREEVKMIAKRRQNLREGLKRIYALLWEQCSPSVQGRLKGEEGWSEEEEVGGGSGCRGVLRGLSALIQSREQRTEISRRTSDQTILTLKKKCLVLGES